jgi:thioesterase domain-containing protein
MMALEIAHLLTDAGHGVDLIALVDTPILNARPSVRMFQQSIARIMQLGDKVGEVRYPRISAILDNVWRQLSNLEQSSLSVYAVNMLGAFRRRVSRLLGKFGPRGGQTANDSGTERLQQELKARDRRLTGVYNHIFREYVPKRTETPIAYFAAEYSGGRLDCLGTNVEMVEVPGGHWGCVTTHADVLAGHLRRKLDASL